MSRKKTAERLWLRYGLTGAAIGAYFGYFFRPVRTPSLLMALGLGAAGTLLTLALRFLRGWRPGIGPLVQSALRAYMTFTLFLVFLEGRHLAYAIGGRALTLAAMAAVGALMGLYFAWKGFNDLYGYTEPGG